MKLSDLSSDQLVCEMASRLNILHDKGGVSLGREFRSACLEIALSYFRQYLVLENELADFLYKKDSCELVAESKKRTVVRQLPLFGELVLSQATDRQLVELAMNEMKKWYEKDRKRKDPLSNYEYELAMAICSFFPESFVPVYRFPENKARELMMAWQDRHDGWSENRDWILYQTPREN